MISKYSTQSLGESGLSGMEYRQCCYDVIRMRAWISLMDISYVSYMRSGDQGNGILYSTQYWYQTIDSTLQHMRYVLLMAYTVDGIHSAYIRMGAPISDYQYCTCGMPVWGTSEFHIHSANMRMRSYFRLTVSWSLENKGITYEHY